MKRGVVAARTARSVVAVDLGAESGRVVLGRYDGRTVTTTEVRRFPNGIRPSGGLLRWDLAGLWAQVRAGLAKAGELAGRIDSVGVDTWGLDYGLLDAGGAIIDDPVAYRDPRTRGAVAAATAIAGRETIYRSTGIPLMEVNALCQLFVEARTDPARLAGARTLLMIPDLFHHLLSGATVAEYTDVTTSGAFDVSQGRWATELMDTLGIPTHLLPDVVAAGTDLGPVRPGPVDHPAYRRALVVTPGSHDTASAVVSVPFDVPAAYVSSGTWSLIGVEIDAPVVTETARQANLTNEGGVLDTIRLLRNGMGLWLLQECRRQWHAEGTDLSYDGLVAAAAATPGGRSLINPDHPAFVTPGRMPDRIRDYCARTGQPVPGTAGEIVRCVLDSLALSYRMALDDLRRATGQRLEVVHIVGGGSRNDLLNRLTADALDLPVVAGPVEAAAMGNILMQLHTLGEFAGLADMRAVVRAGTRPGLVEPRRDGSEHGRELFGRFAEWVAADLAEATVTETRFQASRNSPGQMTAQRSE